MRKASEARFYALTTTTACALALIAGVVGAPVRAVIQDLVFDQYQRWQPRPMRSTNPSASSPSTTNRSGGSGNGHGRATASRRLRKR